MVGSEKTRGIPPLPPVWWADRPLVQMAGIEMSSLLRDCCKTAERSWNGGARENGHRGVAVTHSQHLPTS